MEMVETPSGREVVGVGRVGPSPWQGQHDQIKSCLAVCILNV
jgi:hypothetical protein